MGPGPHESHALAPALLRPLDCARSPPPGILPCLPRYLRKACFSTGTLVKYKVPGHPCVIGSYGTPRFGAPATMTPSTIEPPQVALLAHSHSVRDIRSVRDVSTEPCLAGPGNHKMTLRRGPSHPEIPWDPPTGEI